MTVSNGDDPRTQRRATTPNELSADLGDAGRAWVDAVASAQVHRVAAEQARGAREEAERDAVLASDADRERASQLLAEAFGLGRLTSQELDARTTRALTARTHGELDDVLAGLGGFGTPRERGRHASPIRRAVFWVCAFFTSPFVFFGTMLLLFGSDGGDRIAGIVMLVLFLPGLLALHRWAWPRH